MEIEQKERERIWRKYGPDNINNIFGHDIDHGCDCAIEEHEHLQKEVIQPMRKELKSAKDYIASVETSYGKCGSELIDSKERVSKLEAENKDLRDGIVEFLTWMKKTQRLSIEAITAIDQLLTKNEGL